MAVNPTAARLAAIGNICAQWAYLEYLFAQAIWGMLGLDEDLGKIVTGGLDIRARINMAITLGEEIGAPEELIAALKCDRKAIETNMIHRRNHAVHGIGFASKNPDDHDVWVETHKSKRHRIRKSLPLTELGSLGSEIHEASDRLWTVLHKFGISQDNGNFASSGMAQKLRKAATEIGSSTRS